MMWRRKVDHAYRDQLFREVIDFIHRANPTDELDLRLQERLQDLPADERNALINRVRHGCTPLFIAAKRGLVKITRYLLEVCEAEIERKGVFEVQLDHTIHFVTPLWCAAVVGQLEVCRILVEKGADVNAVSDSGSTAVRSACYMSNAEIVRYLVSKGADINQANNNGGTCLINSVQAPALCEFLLNKGANVNTRDAQFKTALHYAVQELRFETVKLLLEYNADYLAQSKHGDDALQTACLKGCEEIAVYLMTNLDYPPERIADAYELLGATFVDENHDVSKAIEYWKQAVNYRASRNIKKVTDDPDHPVYMGLKPFETLQEVSELAFNLDELRVQSLMVNERVLGKTHKDTIFRLMYRGATFADRLMYARCIELWKYVLDIRLLKDSVLHYDTCVSFETLANIMFDRFEELRSRSNDNWSQCVEDVLFLLDKCIKSFPTAIEQLKKIPTYRRHEENWDGLLKVLAYLLHLSAIMPKTRDEMFELRKRLSSINRIAPTTIKGNSLLHLVAGKLESMTRRGRQAFEERSHIFPDPVTTELLLATGAAVEATNQDGSTALHVASLRVNYSEEVVTVLLKAGAHIDRTNDQGNQPYRMLNGNQECKIKVTNLITLKCLAATKVKSQKIPYEGQIPESLVPFIKLH